MSKAATNARWISRAILARAVFIFALILSAVFDPKIRLLHALQALIYIAVIVLSRRSSAWGFGAGTFISALWNYTNIAPAISKLHGRRIACPHFAPESFA